MHGRFSILGAHVPGLPPKVYTYVLRWHISDNKDLKCHGTYSSRQGRGKGLHPIVENEQTRRHIIISGHHKKTHTLGKRLIRINFY